MKNKILITLAIILILGIGIVVGMNLQKNKLTGNNDQVNSDLNNNDAQTNDNLNVNNGDVVENSEVIKERVKEIVNDELNQLLPLKSLSELTNQDKLQTLLNLYVTDNGYTDTINKEKLDIIFKNSSLGNLGIEYNDIYWENLLKDTEEVFYKLDGDIYKKTSSHGGNQLDIIYKELVDYKHVDNKIIISYKYAFFTTLGDGPVPINLYYNYEDALNNQNKVMTYDPNDYNNSINGEPFSYQEALEAAKNHDFSNNLEKLNTYTYTFEIVNDQILLVDFERK